MAISKLTSRPTWHIRSLRSTAAAGLLLVGSLAATILPASADSHTPVGFVGPSFAGASVTEPTAAKPESKLWYHDGAWWASMYSDTEPGDGGPAFEPGYFVFKLNRTANEWEQQSTQLDPRNSSLADVLSDGNTLYVASHIQDGDNRPDPPLPGEETESQKRLFRYTYNPATKQYVLDAAFAGTGGKAVGKKIADYSSETLTIAKQTTGNVLWATWVESPMTIDPLTQTPSYGAAQVMVSSSTDGGLSWNTFSLSKPTLEGGAGIATATALNTDDISSIVAFNGKIGVMWTNQETRKTYFAVHTDGAAVTDWTSTTVFQDTTGAGGKASDDHLNIKVHAVGNKLFAVTKTGFGDETRPDIVLLACTNGNCATSASWTPYTVYFGNADPAQEHTRPILLIDTTANQEKLHIFTTQPTSGGQRTIYRKTVPTTGLSNATLASALPEPFIRNASYQNLNNATTTKQTVSDQTGLVVLASNNGATDAEDVYLWNSMSLDITPPPAPIASPVGGIVQAGTTVTLTAEAGAMIYYTTDGSNPDPNSVSPTSPTKLYDPATPITISATTTLKFIAVDESGNIAQGTPVTYTVETPVPPTYRVFFPMITK